MDGPRDIRSLSNPVPRSMSRIDVCMNDFFLDDLLDHASALSDDSLDCDGAIATDSSGLEDMSKEGVSVRATNAMKVEPPDSTDKTTKYLEKLYWMLEQCPDHIAAWTQDGTSFAIYNSDALEKNIIPRFFKPIKFESFSRQLNSYGFRKSKFVVSDVIVYEFKHAKFVRGKSDQLLSIKRRRRVKRSATRSVNDMNDDELRSAMTELTRFVQSLKQELAETKALVQSMTKGTNAL
ncbi:hypothetical protein H310_06440 [Aphanomyces invadans]|uniref:HSF-type DNA-binding domain-containing protein n=1 Tax=Aphanomyces invadans TaxID=157072 RepID=A0A024U8H2_9STRA|nr:hypothetical protein H310_06440 [Aphanomyces invadans]ETW01878.1 hypothetical protein H310_06440 [Aphanomyces invadans]|eukprot:XP_008869726.1 hypothetical protein H310_06440 [Aphanomyces invadans]